MFIIKSCGAVNVARLRSRRTTFQIRSNFEVKKSPKQTNKKTVLVFPRSLHLLRVVVHVALQTDALWSTLEHHLGGRFAWNAKSCSWRTLYSTCYIIYCRLQTSSALARVRLALHSGDGFKTGPKAKTKTKKRKTL